jgi:uncharacterized protein with ParB-like and HNH nuclease domain
MVFSMIKTCFSVNAVSIGSILHWIEDKTIAIPEIQRPFVWEAVDVRDFLDSIFKGWPIGYLITWQNEKVKLKDGSLAAGKYIIVDGQQRVIALKAALLGHKVKEKNLHSI